MLRAHRLLPLLATLSLVAACGSAGPSPASSAEATSSPALASLLRAVQQTLGRPAAFRVRLTGGTLLGPEAAPVTGAGTFDFGARRGQLTLRSAVPHRTADAVFTPQVVYVRVPAAAGFLPAGRRWLAIDFASPPALARNFPRVAAQAEAVDPDLALRELLWGAVATVRSSPAALGGEAVQRVDVRVDLARALHGTSGPARGAYTMALQAELTALEGDGVSGLPEIPAHVFLTRQERVVGLEEIVPGAGAGGVAMTFGAAGAPVQATAPPANQTAGLAAITPPGERENQNGGDADGG